MTADFVQSARDPFRPRHPLMIDQGIAKQSAANDRVHIYTTEDHLRRHFIRSTRFSRRM